MGVSLRPLFSSHTLCLYFGVCALGHTPHALIIMVIDFWNMRTELAAVRVVFVLQFHVHVIFIKTMIFGVS